MTSSARSAGVQANRISTAIPRTLIVDLRVLTRTLPHLFVTSRRWRGRGQRQLVLFQIAIANDAFADRSGDLVAVVAARQSADVFLVGEESAFDQHGRMTRICDDKKLFRFRPAIDRLRAREDRKSTRLNSSHVS